MKVRYGLIRYMYTQYMNTARFGGPVIQPFLFYYPTD